MHCSPEGSESLLFLSRLLDAWRELILNIFDAQQRLESISVRAVYALRMIGMYR